MQVDVQQIKDRVAEKADLVHNLRSEMGKVIVGQEEMVSRLLVGLLCDGHILLEGVPGLAKTTAIKTLAQAISTGFQRIQFTPDLLPADLVGTLIYLPTEGTFKTRKGPVFSNFILADEINRAPSKVQSALLEAMQERQVTIGEETFPLDRLFLVLATQNPIEQEGTYPLPEAQVDRFMLKVCVGYPPEEREAAILDNVEDGFTPRDLSSAGLVAVLDLEMLADLRATTRNVRAEEMVRRYVTRIVRATRQSSQVSLGARPRAAVMLMLAAKAHAVLAAREFVTPDDVKAMALPALRHRILLRPEIEVEGRTADDCVRELLEGIEVPR